jgi:pimeloyl-ACP methyl ester carboxylesterase
MSTSAIKGFLKHFRRSDLRGIALLTRQAVTGGARLTEGLHQAIIATVGLPTNKTTNQLGGISGLVYRSIHGINGLIGRNIDALLTKLQPHLDHLDQTKAQTIKRQNALAAINGVVGDRLAAHNNSWATPMSLRYLGEALNPERLPSQAEVSDKLVVMIHGLCMNDLQWRKELSLKVLDHGQVLAQRLGYTPIYLRYNSGLHISTNGQSLAKQLEQLMTHWPHPVKKLTLIGHSMGGLVARSACHYAQQAKLDWYPQLTHLITLGTPHHGAPLEQLSHIIENVLNSSRFTAPFTAITQLRSGGITDLGYGYLIDEDWQHQHRFKRNQETHTMIALPAHVACFALASTTASTRTALAEHLIGDGLVPLRSALGEHEDPRKSLAFALNHQAILYDMDHMALLHDPKVTQQLLDWLS